MCASMIPAPSMAYADGTEDTEYSMVTSAPFYSEDFEENGFVDMAKTNENGWTYNPGNVLHLTAETILTMFRQAQI